MTISRFAKAIVYLVVTALLLTVSVILQGSMHTIGGLEDAYYRSDAFLFIVAAGCLGTALYSFRAYTRRHREHRGDSLFLLFVGLVLMIAVVILIINFGGLGDAFHEQGFTAANLNIVILTILPVPFFIRALVLGLTMREEGAGRRSGILAVCTVVLVAFVAVFATGRIMNLLHYNTDSSYSAGSTAGAEEK